MESRFTPRATRKNERMPIASTTLTLAILSKYNSGSLPGQMTPGVGDEAGCMPCSFGCSDRYRLFN